MTIAIIVEGKNDKSRLRRLLLEEVTILCTFGSLNTDRLEDLKKKSVLATSICSPTMIHPAKKYGAF